MKKQNLQIEGLRGVAILIIVLYHVIDRYQQIYCGSSIKFMDFWGTLGVTIFLMISSYLMADVRTKELRTLDGIKSLLWKVFRLWPTYFVSILTTFIITRFYELPDRTVNIKEFVANIFFINRFIGLAYVDGAHWYLGVLLTVSFIFIVFKRFNIHNKPIPYFIWLIIELWIDKIFLTEDMYPLGGPFIGCVCIGIAIKNLQYLKEKNKVYWQWIVLCLFSLGCTLLSRGTICTIELIVVTPIILLCGLQKIKILESKLFVFFGVISYPLYLIHQNISFIVQRILTDNTGCYSVAWSGIALIIVIAFGIVLYYLVEKTVQRIIAETKAKRVY